MERKEETKEVKRFLIKQGYQNVKIGHGKGTAWGWLHLSLDIPKPQGCYCTINQYGQTDKCHLCRNTWQEAYQKIGSEVMVLTNRTGDYGGRINIDIGWI